MQLYFFFCYRNMKEEVNHKVDIDIHNLSLSQIKLNGDDDIQTDW